jgi:hypothetical protein
VGEAVSRRSDAKALNKDCSPAVIAAAVCHRSVARVPITTAEAAVMEFLLDIGGASARQVQLCGRSFGLKAVTTLPPGTPYLPGLSKDRYRPRMEQPAAKLHALFRLLFPEWLYATTTRIQIVSRDFASPCGAPV